MACRVVVLESRIYVGYIHCSNVSVLVGPRHVLTTFGLHNEVGRWYWLYLPSKAMLVAVAIAMNELVWVCLVVVAAAAVAVAVALHSIQIYKYPHLALIRSN